MSKRKEGTSSGFILYLGYRLDKRQAAPALTRNRWSLDEMDSDPEEVDNEKDIEVREEVETRGIHGKVSVLCEVTFLLLKFNVNVLEKGKQRSAEVCGSTGGGKEVVGGKS